MCVCVCVCVCVWCVGGGCNNCKSYFFFSPNHLNLDFKDLNGVSFSLPGSASLSQHVHKELDSVRSQRNKLGELPDLAHARPRSCRLREYPSQALASPSFPGLIIWTGTRRVFGGGGGGAGFVDD